MTEASILVSGWERVARHMDELRERLRRAIAALTAAGVPYAVVGGNAVAEWVGRIDEDAVRTTRDVDLLLERNALPAARAALESVGFIYHQLLEIDLFVDGPQGKPSGGVHILYAGEKVRPDDEHELPRLDQSERGAEFQVANLEALLRMKLIANRLKDRVHLLDMIGVGLIDATWPGRFPPPLDERLQQLLDDPNG